MAASPFSFHCMICFEEFHPDDRYPVVLPCGHTYVCNVCAERLEKCMECRTALFVSAPRPPQLQTASAPPGRTGSSPWASARSGSRATAARYGEVNNAPPPPPVKTRLPLPKNVVLLSLIEATELATEDAEKAAALSKSPLSMTEVSLDGEDKKSDEDEEEEKIRTATSLAVSVCGTYAVANKKGLAIYPSRPTLFTMEKSSSGTGMGEEDVDALVRFFHLDHKLDVDSISLGEESSLKKTDTKEEPPAHLSYGDRVQIVSVDGDWAKLARGYGFIRASHVDLVKVGGPLDRACKLEAMLRSLSIRRKELRREQNQVDNRFVRLMNDLQTSLLNDEDLTVVVGETFTPTGREGNDENGYELELRDNVSSQREGDNIIPCNDDVIKPSPLIRQTTPPTQVTRAFSCFANDVFDALGGSEHGQQDHSAGQVILEAMTHPFGAAVERTIQVEADRNTSLFPAATHPSPSAIRAGARAWRERHGRPPSQGIDFRTGMSGHLALTSSHAYSHEYLSREQRAFPKMSNHSGLTVKRPARRTESGLETHGTPPRDTVERKETFEQSGSM